MDDRTLVAVSTQALDDDLALTERFDQECGFRENASKRQRWSEDDEEPSRVEHLGLTAVPTNVHEPILPKHGWEKLYHAIKILHTIPGGFQLRIRLAVAYIRPLWDWASPILAPVPADVPNLLRRAILRTRCSW